MVGGETVSSTDRKLNPAGRNTSIQPLHKGYRLWIKTIEKTKYRKQWLIDLAREIMPEI
nr:hypothetical protein [uncultured Anaerobutyricum sp.]